MASVAVEQTGITNEAFQALESCRSLEKDELTIEMVEAGSPLRLRSSDSGCELSSEGSESPTSYRRLDEESSTGYLTCSSVETTVDQSSSIYQEFTQTLNQVRLDNLNILKEPLVLHSMLLESESSVSLKPIIADEPSDDQGTIGHLSEQYDKSKWLDGADGGKEPDMPVMQLTEKASRKSRGRLLPQVLASLALAIAAMIEGYSSGYTSPALASMSHPNSTIPVNLHEASWIGSLMPLSALLGGILGGSLVEHFGRKTTIMATGPPYILSWLLITFASNLPMVYAGRSIQGFCVGLTTLTLPIYLGETIQPEVRGFLGLLPTTIGNIGILFCYVLGSYIDWKILAAIGATLPIPFMICMWFVPETPRWYISQGKYEEARSALQWLRGKKTDVKDEFFEIETNCKAQVATRGGIRELFKMVYLRPLLISLGLMFFQQLSGINAVIFYTVTIFEKSGGSVDSNLSSIIIGLANFFATLGSNVVIDRVGRKILLNLSGFFMAISLGALGVFYILQHKNHDVSHLGWLPLATLIVYIIAFSIGYGPIPWLMMGEIFPSKVRGHAASVATAFNWACSFIVTKTFNDLLEILGAHGAFWFFGILCFVSIFFVIAFVPETKGQSLESIEQRMLEKFKKKKAAVELNV